jgi:hypothetical protein
LPSSRNGRFAAKTTRLRLVGLGFLGEGFEIDLLGLGVNAQSQTQNTGH